MDRAPNAKPGGKGPRPKHGPNALLPALTAPEQDRAAGIHRQVNGAATQGRDPGRVAATDAAGGPVAAAAADAAVAVAEPAAAVAQPAVAAHARAAHAVAAPAPARAANGQPYLRRAAIAEDRHTSAASGLDSIDSSAGGSDTGSSSDTSSRGGSRNSDSRGSYSDRDDMGSEESFRRAAHRNHATRGHGQAHSRARLIAARREVARLEAEYRDAARREAARHEVARRDADRREAAHREAARRDAARRDRHRRGSHRHHEGGDRDGRSSRSGGGDVDRAPVPDDDSERASDTSSQAARRKRRSKRSKKAISLRKLTRLVGTEHRRHLSLAVIDMVVQRGENTQTCNELDVSFTAWIRSLNAEDASERKQQDGRRLARLKTAHGGPVKGSDISWPTLLRLAAFATGVEVGHRKKTRDGWKKAADRVATALKKYARATPKSDAALVMSDDGSDDCLPIAVASSNILGTTAHRDHGTGGQRVPRDPSGAQGTAKKCFTCQQVGHIARDCPQGLKTPHGRKPGGKKSG